AFHVVSSRFVFAGKPACGVLSRHCESPASPPLSSGRRQRPATLAPVSRAPTIASSAHHVNPWMSATHGQYPATKEGLAGVDLLECASMDEVPTCPAGAGNSWPLGFGKHPTDCGSRIFGNHRTTSGKSTVKATVTNKMTWSGSGPTSAFAERHAAERWTPPV